MAATVKLWMLVPHYDFPAEGPLALGSIISSLDEPGDSLNEGSIVDIPQSSLHPSYKEDYRVSIESVNDGGAGVAARFLSVFTWGKLGASSSSKTISSFHFRRLETTYFSPTPSYVKQAISTHDVMEYLEGADYVPVYMITGLKISRGIDTQVFNRKTYGYEGQGKTGLTATVAGFPIAIDAGDITVNHSGLNEISFGGSSDFVIGYRLGKISFHVGDDGEHIPKVTNYTVGAMWAEEDDVRVDTSATITAGVHFDGDDAIVQELGQEKLFPAIDEEDDQKCNCFVVQAN